MLSRRLDWSDYSDHNGPIKSVSLTELKANLSRYIRRVRRGGEVQILSRGVSVARLVGLRRAAAGDRDRRERLIRAGVLRAGTADASPTLEHAPISVPGADVSGALSEERGDRV